MLIVYGFLGVTGAISLAQNPIDIGSRRELFVDDYLIERLEDAQRVLHHPTSREVSLTRNKPWEGNVSGYTTVFQDGEIYRMYYRGTHTIYTPGKVTSPHQEVVCYAESGFCSLRSKLLSASEQDGIHWTRPLPAVRPEG